MSSFDLSAVRSDAVAAGAAARVAILLDESRVKLRHIELEADGEIPPCRMSEDVVFVVLKGSVVLTCEGDEEVVSAPGAAYVPAEAATRSVRAMAPAILLAVMCREGSALASMEAAAPQTPEGA
jgi:quercetin dioxygenase-like cupin family protein